MWFKNIRIYRLPAYWNMTAEQITAALLSNVFAPLQSMDVIGHGWVAPVADGDLVYRSGRQMLIALQTEKKLLPASVINAGVKQRVAEIEEEQGYKPGKKQREEIKEQVTDELLPQAFTTTTVTRAWIDPVNGWLVVDAGSPARSDLIVTHLIRAIDKLPLETLYVAKGPEVSMTEWLASDEAPAGFTVDQDAELCSSGESKATVRYSHHTLEAGDIGNHIKAGKRCTKLALTWNDKVSFVLHRDFSIKRITPLDVLKETADGASQDEIERFESDFNLMTGELNGLLCSLLQAFGGEVERSE